MTAPLDDAHLRQIPRYAGGEPGTVGITRGTACREKAKQFRKVARAGVVAVVALSSSCSASPASSPPAPGSPTAARPRRSSRQRPRWHLRPARETDSGGRLADPHRRSRRLPHRARLGHPAQHRHGPQPRGRPAHADAVPGRPDRAGRRPARRDRSPPLPGPAHPGGRAARQGRGRARQRAHRSRALPHPGQGRLHPAAADGHAGLRGRPARGVHQGRPGPDRQHPPAAHLQRASSPRSPAAPGCASWIPATWSTPTTRAGSSCSPRSSRSRWCSRIPEDNLPPVLARQRAGGAVPGGRLRPRGPHQAGDRHPGRGRQPDRPDDRHRQAQGRPSSMPTARCSRTSSSTRACWSTRCTARCWCPHEAIQRGAQGPSSTW